MPGTLKTMQLKEVIMGVVHVAMVMEDWKQIGQDAEIMEKKTTTVRILWIACKEVIARFHATGREHKSATAMIIHLWSLSLSQVI